MNFFITPGLIFAAVILLSFVGSLIILARCKGKQLRIGGRVYDWKEIKILLLKGVTIYCIILALWGVYELWQDLDAVEERTQRHLKMILRGIGLNLVVAGTFFYEACKREKQLSRTGLGKAE